MSSTLTISYVLFLDYKLIIQGGRQMKKEENFIQNDSQNPKLFILQNLSKSQKRKLLSIVIVTFFFCVLTKCAITVSAAAAEDLSTEYIVGLKGERVEHNIHLPLEAKGSCSFQVSGKLPKGLKAHTVKGDDRLYVIEGKIEETLDGAQIQVKAKDKKGKEYTIPVCFYIGSKERIVTWVEQYGTVLSGDKEEYESIDIKVIGGSGEYQLDFLTPVEKMISKDFILNEGGGKDLYHEDEFGMYKIPISDDMTAKVFVTNEVNIVFRINLSDDIAAGSHTIPYRVTDKKDKQKKTEGSFTFRAEQAVKLTGKCLTADGKPFISNHLEFFMVSHSLGYEKNQFSAYEYNKKNGKFVAYVAPSQKYKVVCSGSVCVDDTWHEHEEEITIKNFKVGKKDKVCQLKFPRYKIMLKGNYNFKQVQYLKKGKYSWNRAALDNPDKKYSYHYKKSFKANKSRTIKVKVKKEKRVVLKIGKKKTAVCNQYMKFKTKKSGVYTFTSSKIKGKIHADLVFFDDDGVQTVHEASNGKGNKAFKMKGKLGGDRVFFLKVTGDEREKFTIKVKYSKK